MRKAESTAEMQKGCSQFLSFQRAKYAEIVGYYSLEGNDYYCSWCYHLVAQEPEITEEISSEDDRAHEFCSVCGKKLLMSI